MVELLSPEWVELHRRVLGGLPEVPGATARLQHVVSGGPHGEVAYTLAMVDGALKIKLKRVDIVNCDAAFGNIQLFM